MPRRLHAIIAAQEMGIPEIVVNVNFLREKERAVAEVKSQLGLALSGVKVLASPVIPVGRAAKQIPWPSFPI